MYDYTNPKIKSILEGVAQIEFVKHAPMLASKGYALNSLRVSGGKKNSSVGLDIGNAITVVTTITE